MTIKKIARNDPCPCGSGEKYKQCCLQSETARPANPPGAAEISNALQIATDHHQAGRLLEAEAVCKQILQVSPNHPDILYLTGMIAYQVGMHDVAAVFFSGVIEAAPPRRRPQQPGRRAHGARPGGGIGRQLPESHFAAAQTSACALQPGECTQGPGQTDEAIASYRKAVLLTPDNAEPHNSLGDVLQTQGKLTETIASYRKALRINPNLAEVHYNLADALYEQGRMTQTIASCREALRLKPDYAEACVGLGKALRALGQLDDAVTFGRLAVLLKPDDAEVYNNLGNSLRDQGKLEEAIACYRQALSIQSNSATTATTYSNPLLTMQYMSTVTPAEAFSEHQRYADQYEAPFKANRMLHPNSRDPERRLRIGYVSGDFRNHAVTFFIEPILASHDKSQVEIYCYYNHTKHDSHTERIAAYADHWLACSWMSDEALADRIRADGIDILVDLSGHTTFNRLPMFARKPAPLQATWIGYAGSTGLTAMDYRITNEGLDPPGLTERYHSETLLRMPDSVVAYRPEPDCPLVNPLPALTSGEFVFASLNNLIKTNPSVVDLWARILHALPHARLMLGNVTDSGTRERVIDQFGQAGVAANRLILQPRMSLNDYLALHHQIDLALDPFPYNGGTTTVHALWMGVPVVTLAGEHMVSRCAVPLLSRVGLDEFITHNEEDYFQRAVRMAQDLPGLDRIRQSLRERMSTSNHGSQTVTRHLEAAYREMWRKWCTAEAVPLNSRWYGARAACRH